MKRSAPWILIGVAVLLIALVARQGDRSGPPLDPRSTGPSGARGLVLLLREVGASTVRISATPPARTDAAVAVLLTDQLGRSQRRALRAWVGRGGTLVVADPGSEFVPAIDRTSRSPFAPAEERVRAGCALPSVRGVRTVSITDAALYRIRPGAVGCFKTADGDAAYLVARAEGDGTVVALGGAGVFTNDRLSDGDNAVLAVGLMAPRAGTEVTVLEPAAPGSGDQGLGDLVPRPVRTALWQLVAAFGFVVLWRGRRLGRPVVETQPVDIAASELVVATGQLLQQAGRRESAADMLRFELRRELAERFGIPVDAPPERFASALAGQGVDPARAEALLTPRPVPDDPALVAFAAAVASLRREVIHG